MPRANRRRPTTHKYDRYGGLASWLPSMDSIMNLIPSDVKTPTDLLEYAYENPYLRKGILATNAALWGYYAYLKLKERARRAAAERERIGRNVVVPVRRIPKVRKMRQTRIEEFSPDYRRP